MKGYGAARVSERLTDQIAARLRAAPLESEAQTGRQDVRSIILNGEVALVVAVMTVTQVAGYIAEKCEQGDHR
jgi:hypothetical protein